MYSYVQGTIRYMSPELLKGLRNTPSDDIYSLGITMWQLKHNKQPYHSITSNEEIAYKVVKTHLRPDAKSLELNKNHEINHHNALHSMGCTHCDSLTSSLILPKMLEMVTSSELYCPPPDFNTKQIMDQFLSAHRLRKNISFFVNQNQNLVGRKLQFSPIPKKFFSKTKSDAVQNQQINKKKFNGTKEKLLIPDGCLVSANEILEYFSNSSVIQNEEELEQKYEHIYQKCWHFKLTERPSALELINNIQLILNHFEQV